MADVSETLKAEARQALQGVVTPDTRRSDGAPKFFQNGDGPTAAAHQGGRNPKRRSPRTITKETQLQMLRCGAVQQLQAQLQAVPTLQQELVTLRARVTALEGELEEAKEEATEWEEEAEASQKQLEAAQQQLATRGAAPPPGQAEEVTRLRQQRRAHAPAAARGSGLHTDARYTDAADRSAAG